MRCMRCAREVTLGWMKLVRHTENPHTGEVVERLLCEPCVAAVEGEAWRLATVGSSADRSVEEIAGVLARIIVVDGRKQP